MRVYIVTAGEYSDKHNVAVTFDRDEAINMVRVHKNVYGIGYEAFDTNDFPKFITEDPIWECTCWKECEPNIEEMKYDTVDATSLNKLKQHGECGDNIYYEAGIQAKDKETAKKIFLDLITVQQAVRGGIT